jgi:acetyl-CoA acetyltransferase
MPDTLRGVSIVGIGQIPVQKESSKSLKEMGAEVVRLAMEDAGVDYVDGLFAGNMLADELQHQKHIATLIASEAGLRGIDALQVRAATATGAAALRMAYFAVASGEARLAVAVGVEKMSSGPAVPALAKALDARTETAMGATLLSQNARLMQIYMDRYGVSRSMPIGMPAPIPMPYSRIKKSMTAPSVTQSLSRPPCACMTLRRFVTAQQRSC